MTQEQADELIQRQIQAATSFYTTVERACRLFAQATEQIQAAYNDSKLPPNVVPFKRP